MGSRLVLGVLGVFGVIVGFSPAAVGQEPTTQQERDIGALVKYTSNIRGKTSKLQSLTEKYKLAIDEDLDEIKAAVANYQKKLMAAVSGMENESEETVSIPKQVKPASKR
jgi:hypothetical protein